MSRDGGVRRAAVVVGREVELDRLGRALHAARAGASRCIFLVGEGGVGKTRLLGEVAEEGRRLGVSVMAGRAPVTSPVAFSVVSEALRSWLRGAPTPPAMGPFDAGLRLLLPEWPADPGGPNLSDAQLRLLALEGWVRLVQHIAEAGNGAVLLLDDLHEADPDSLEAIRYLATAARDRVLIVGALRSRESTRPEQVVRALARDGAAEVLDLDPLGAREVAELLGALLDAEPPAALVDDVMDRTDGVPLLVEEVLEAHLRSGSVGLDAAGAQWRGGGSVVPRTVCDLVEARVERLTKPQRDLLTAGAVLGDFDAEVLAVVAQQPVAVVGESVAAATDIGLLERVGGSVDYRHALLREAVLDAALPHVLDALHRRCASALADIGPTDAAMLARRAQHLEHVGDDDAAAELLTDAAAVRLSGHALLSAEELARHACDLARLPATRVAACDTLARVLAAEGRWTDALALDTETDRAHGEQEARRYRMASCAMDAAQPDLARQLIKRAVETGDDSPRVQVIASRLDIASGNADAGLRSAERALAEATAMGDVEVQCAALDVQARALDYAGRRAEARDAWIRQAEIAQAAGITEARLRAVVQLGKLEVFEGTAPARLYEAVDLARAAGALVEQAWAEENLAIALIVQGDPQAGRQILDEAIARCRDLRFDQLPYLLAARGGAASACEDEATANAFIDEAERLAPTADLAIHTYGIRADMACRAGRYDEAVEWCERGVELLRAQPGGMPSDIGCWLAWFLAGAGRMDDAARALPAAGDLPDDVARWHGRPVLLAGADALVRGDAAGVDAAFESATGRMPLDLALMRVIAAQVLGGPAAPRWLREALDLYESVGVVAAASRVRRLLRESGAPVPRRRRAAVDVPEQLAQHGVTAREAEVLQLLGEGLGNAAIAERLYVSVRTVETHVSSLLAKLHADGRGQLIALSALSSTTAADQ